MKAIYEPTGRAAEYSHLSCNLYRGCEHGCHYCYAPKVLRMKPEEFARATPRAGIIQGLERDAERLAGTAKRVLLCFTCDPYQPIEREHNITHQAIGILRRQHIAFQILTKAGYAAARDFDLYGDDDAFAVTLTSLKQSDQQRDEPVAAPPGERIGALTWAYQKGITTWVSLEPVIDPDESLRIIKETHEFVDHYKIGTLNHVDCKTTPGQWRDFGQMAIRLCRTFGKTYYIKQDLQRYLGDFAFENTDTRTV